MSDLAQEQRLSDATDSRHPRHDVLEAWRLRALSREEFASLGSPGPSLSRVQLLHLMGFGVLAPTSHNTVPQRFRLNPKSNELTLVLDRKFVLPESDPSGRQATISCGCVLSHLTIAAGVYGWQAIHEFVPALASATQPLAEESSRYTDLVRTTFVRLERPSFDATWLRAMLNRKMVRSEYDPREALSDEAANELHRIVSKYAPVRLHLLADAPSLMVLGKFQELADTTVFNRRAFARELGDWLFPNQHPSPLGMRGREFGLNDEAALRFHLGLRGHGQLLPDEVSALAKAGNLGMRSASAIAVLTVEQDSVLTRLLAGQAFAEVVLALTNHGYVVSMHAAVTEVEAPNLALRGRLRTVARPVVVFRLGKPSDPADGERLHAARPPLTDLILSPATSRASAA